MNDKKAISLTGSSPIDKMLFAPKEEPDSTEPPTDPEAWESPSGYLRCSRHQVFSVILIQKDKTMLMIPYSQIESGDGVFNGDSFTFLFYRGEVAYEAVIEGTITHMQRVADKLAGGKAELIRANGDEVRSVTWAQVVESRGEG